MEDANALAGLDPMHPGELLREEILPAIGLNEIEMAENLSLDETAVADVVHERAPVTADMALRLAKLCGNSPAFWLNLQRDYDLGRLAPAMANELDAIPTLRDTTDESRR